MDSCASCGAALATPLVCSACGALFAPDPAPDPFAALGLEPALAVDQPRLQKTLIALTRKMHPDYFAGEPEKRALAERNTALLNAAYRVVSDPYRRSDWLVRQLGGPDEQGERQLPQAFLAEVLEWNETLEQARAGSGGTADQVDALESELEERRAASFQRLAALLQPLPAHGAPALREARRELNAVRYVDRTLEEIAALRAAQAG
jgi:molecular chaperone HscB